MKPHTRRAFSLWEMLVIIGLLSIAALISARLFTASMRVVGQTPSAQGQIVSLDHLSRALGRDVWGATAIDVKDRQIELPQSGGATVQWKLEDGGAVRSAGETDEPERWEIALPLTAQRQGPALVLTVMDSHGTSTQRRLLSQVLVAEAMR